MKRKRGLSDLVTRELQQEQQWFFAVQRANAFLEYMRTATEEQRKEVMIDLLKEAGYVFVTSERLSRTQWQWVGVDQQVLLLINTHSEKTIFRCGQNAIPPPFINTSTHYFDPDTWLNPNGKLGGSQISNVVISRVWDQQPLDVSMIPVDMWEYIFSFLTDIDDLVHCRLLCKSWYTAATRPTLWRPYMNLVHHWSPIGVPEVLRDMPIHVQVLRCLFYDLTKHKSTKTRLVVKLMTPTYASFLCYVIHWIRQRSYQNQPYSGYIHRLTDTNVASWRVYYFDQQLAGAESPLPDTLRVSKTGYTFFRNLPNARIKRTIAQVVVCDRRNNVIAYFRKNPTNTTILYEVPARLYVLHDGYKNGIQCILEDPQQSWERCFYNAHKLIK